MKLIYILISITFFLYGCGQKKKERIISDDKAVIMPVSILSDTTVYELIIVPDTDLCTSKIKYSCENDTFVGFSMLENEIRMRQLNITGQYIKILKRMTLENRLPDYYGGSYNNSDGVLTILVTGDTIENKQDLVKMLEGSEFIVQSCEYSYNALMQIVDSLNVVIYKKENQIKLNNLNLDYWGILEDKNRIVIAIDNCNSQKMKLFKKQIMDSPSFIFRSSSDSITFH